MNYEERMDCQLNQDPAKCLESPMERSLYEELKTQGMAPIMQYKLDKFFLDLAFPDVKVAVEYDGSHHFDNDEDFTKDKERRKKIEALGWKMISVNHQYFDEFEVNLDLSNTKYEKSIYHVSKLISLIIRDIRAEKRQREKEDSEEKRRVDMLDQLKDRLL